MSVRTAVKQLVERSVILSGVAGAARHRRRHDVLVLAYHNIVPEGEPAAGDGSLHLPQRAFGEQLDRLQRTHEIVPVSSLLGDTVLASTARADRPRAVITFDDAYRGAMTAGIAELKRRQVPATVFVAPAYVGGKTFWWDVLTPPEAGSLDASLRETALSLDAGQGHRILARAHQQSFPASHLPRNATCASEDELEEALKHTGLTYGSHTWSHPNLAALAPAELADELVRPQEWLARYGDRVVSAISYPYGCANATVWQAAKHAGYAAGFMISGGWVHPSSTAPHALPRLNIPAGVSADGFALRTAGLIAA